MMAQADGGKPAIWVSYILEKMYFRLNGLIRLSIGDRAHTSDFAPLFSSHDSPSVSHFESSTYVPISHQHIYINQKSSKYCKMVEYYGIWGSVKSGLSGRIWVDLLIKKWWPAFECCYNKKWKHSFMNCIIIEVIILPDSFLNDWFFKRVVFIWNVFATTVLFDFLWQISAAI